MKMAPISVLIPTFNEELNLPAALRSLDGWTDDVWVVDSFSTDRTLEIARQFGASTVQHPFESHARQKNWALANLPWRHPWLLLLDADEQVPPLLREEITQVVLADGHGLDGFWMRYRLMFYGKWIRHCGWYPTWLLRLVRRSKARFEDRPVDEHVVLDGPAGRLENDLLHQSLRDMDFWIAKHNHYSTLNARIFHDLLRGHETGGVEPRLLGTQAERKRFIKQKIWPRLPGRALWFFLYMYVLRLGFLDGKHGFMFCAMHAVFQQFTTAKLWELKYYKAGAPEGAIVVKQKAAE
jgi:glycosyltransferase involved in cell wall biosynthesis